MTEISSGDSAGNPGDIQEPCHYSEVGFDRVCLYGRWFGLFQMFHIECHDLVERNLVEVVVEVHMAGAGDDEEFLVVAGELLEGVFAEVAGMGLFAVDEKDGAADFTGVGHYRHVQEGEGRGDIPAAVGVEGTAVVATGSLVIGVIVFYELWGIFRKRIHDTSCEGVCAVPVVLGALGIQLDAQVMTGVGGVCRIEVAVGSDAAHVIHGGSDGGLDAGVD